MNNTPPKKNYPYLGGAVGTPNDFGGGIYPPPNHFGGGNYPPQNKCSLKKKFGGGVFTPPKLNVLKKKILLSNQLKQFLTMITKNLIV